MKIIRLILILLVFTMTARGVCHCQEDDFSGGRGFAPWERLNEEAVEFYKAGNFAQALATAEEALKASEYSLGKDSPVVATALNNLALLYYKQKQYDKAGDLYARSLEISQKAYGNESAEAAQVLNNLGTLSYAKADYDKAESYYRRSLAIRDKALGPDHPDTRKSVNNLITLHHARGAFEQKSALSNYFEDLFVSTSDIYDRINSGRDIVMLDVRSRDMQNKKHIPNSIRFAAENFKDSREDLSRILQSTNRGAVIVVFSSADEDISEIVKHIRALGYRAYALKGGFASWESR
ncbi:MAG: tetratricopeptide repeat protein [Candidatus Omnitrophota bacterium]|jgi:tetratricopeptide (TPR) repeat protein